MAKLLFALALLLTTSTSFAAFSEGFDSGKWQQLMDKIKREGKFERLPLGVTLGLARGGSFDINKPEDQVVNYLTAEVMEMDGALQIMQVTANTENWRRQIDGSWQVDQRLYWMHWSGDVTKVARFVMTFSDKGLLKERKEIFYGRGPEADELFFWGQELAAWQATLP